MDETYNSVGEMVDRLADQYIARGMDAYTANLRALLDASKLMCDIPKSMLNLILAVLREPQKK